MAQFLKIAEVRENHHHAHAPMTSYLNIENIKTLRSRTIIWTDGRNGAVDKDGNGVQSIAEAETFDATEISMGYTLTTKVFSTASLPETIAAIRKIQNPAPAAKPEEAA